MELFVSIRRGEYHDSLELLLATSILQEKEGIGKANIAMGTENGFNLFRTLGIYTPEMSSAGIADLIIAAEADSRETYDRSVEETFRELSGHREENAMPS